MTGTDILRIDGNRTLNGAVSVPGDKSISHRALMFAATANGTSTLSGLSNGSDVRATRNALQAMGATVVDNPDATLTVTGTELADPAHPIDMGNSGTGLRLLLGLCSGYDLFATFTGDVSLSARPLDRIGIPLQQMGAKFDARSRRFLPAAIRGGGLKGITYRTPVASAQIKSAVLLAGLRACGPTTVIEPVRTRPHTEELLAAFGAAINVDETAVTVQPGQLSACNVAVPGDPSQAAFWVAGAAGRPGARITVESMYMDNGRARFLDVLDAMGADIRRAGSTVTVVGKELVATRIDKGTIADVIDEIPALAVAAAMARGTTVITDAAELRVKESDRIDTTAAMLAAFGVPVSTAPDGLSVTGGGPLRAGVVDAHHDHRIAMAAAMLAIAAPGTSTVSGWSAVDTSYPTFVDTLTAVAT